MSEENLIIEEQEEKKENKPKKKPPLLLFGAGLVIAFIVIYALLSFLEDEPGKKVNIPTNKDIQAQIQYEQKQKKREQAKIKTIDDKPFIQKKEEKKSINIDALLANLSKKSQQSIYEDQQPKDKNNKELLDEILKSQDEVQQVDRNVYEVSGETSSQRKIDYKIKKDEYEQEKQTMFAYSKTYKKAAYYAGEDEPSMIQKTRNKPITRTVQENSLALENLLPQKKTQPKPRGQEEDRITTLIYNSNPPVTVFQGEWLDCVLFNRIEASTNESPVVAIVYRDFYDDSGQYVVIPSGTRIIGKSLAINYMGAERLFITFSRMILPNGKSVRFPYSRKSLQALDELGANGVVSDINRHYLLQFGAAIFLGVLDGFAAAAQNNYDPYSSGAYVIDRTTRNFEKVLAVVMQRYSNIMPTITVEQGEKMKIFIADDILISPYAKIRERHYAHY